MRNRDAIVDRQIADLNSRIDNFERTLERLNEIVVDAALVPMPPTTYKPDRQGSPETVAHPIRLGS